MSRSVGEQMLDLAADLYPICRSITGPGVRETLARLSRVVPLTVHEVPSGTPVFDWTVPKEWNIRDAYIKNAQGERVVDFRQSNLHVVSYSAPVRQRLSLAELRPHLFTVPEHPDWIPYRTSYYQERWGFCLSHRQFERLTEGEYEVCIDSALEEGSLTYAECYLPGETKDEVLISCHICHPSLANDNLSGMAIAAFGAKELQNWPRRRYSYRFLFIPGTIGSITWLALHEGQANRIKHGLVLTCLGDAGHMTYKKSRRGSAEVDRAVCQVLRAKDAQFEVTDFTPYGYDERQFCSPGFNLPVGCLMRTPNGQYPEYHTSADDLSLIQPGSLQDSYETWLAVVKLLEHNRAYINLAPKCEPQLGKRGLYATLGGNASIPMSQNALLWVLNFSDGDHSLLDIAERSGTGFPLLQSAAEALEQKGLLRRIDSPRA